MGKPQHTQRVTDQGIPSWRHNLIAITLTSAYIAKPIYTCMYMYNLPLILSCPAAVQGRQTKVLNLHVVCKDVEAQSIACLATAAHGLSGLTRSPSWLSALTQGGLHAAEPPHLDQEPARPAGQPCRL